MHRPHRRLELPPRPATSLSKKGGRTVTLTVLGRSLRADEVQYFTDKVGRIGAIFAITTSFSVPQLETHFERKKNDFS